MCLKGRRRGQGLVERYGRIYFEKKKAVQNGAVLRHVHAYVCVYMMVCMYICILIGYVFDVLKTSWGLQHIDRFTHVQWN